MTLGPRQLNRLTELDEQQVHALITFFDSFLKENYTGMEGDEGLRCYFKGATSTMAVPQDKILKEICHRYRQVGWPQISYGYDDERGPYIIFFD